MICRNYFSRCCRAVWIQRIGCHHSNSSAAFTSTALKTTPLSVSALFIKRTGARKFSTDSYIQILSTSPPVLELQKILINIHDYSGLPWWAVILITTLGIRTVVTFPLAVHQYQVSARLQNIHAELSKMAPELNKEVTIAARMNNWDLLTTKRVYKNNMKRYYNQFILRDNCHPFKGAVLILIQVPLWICFSAALRNMTFMMPHNDTAAVQLFDELRLGGLLWFQDLTVADHIFIPVLLGVINLTLIEINNLKNLSGDFSLFGKIMIDGARIVTVLVCVAASICPTSMTFYWLCSSLCGLGQSVLLTTPKIRRLLRIPSVANEASTPFKDIYNNLKAKKIRRK